VILLFMMYGLVKTLREDYQAIPEAAAQPTDPTATLADPVEKAGAE
jgi:choline-glycine betaine transporter